MKTEDSRLEEFRQLRNEIRGSGKHLLVGIDIGKEKFLTHTEAAKVQNNLSQVVFGMEPTANYHKPLGEYLITRGHEVVLVSGNAVAKNRQLLDGRWDKHDGKDAANVADLISQGKCHYYEYPCREVRDLRGLLSLKRKLKKQA